MSWNEFSSVQFRSVDLYTRYCSVPLPLPFFDLGRGFQANSTFLPSTVDKSSTCRPGWGLAKAPSPASADR